MASLCGCLPSTIIDSTNPAMREENRDETKGSVGDARRQTNTDSLATIRGGERHDDLNERAQGRGSVLHPSARPVNAARPVKRAVLLQLVNVGCHPTDPIPLDTSVALVEAGFMRACVSQVAGDSSTTTGDRVFESSDSAADMCLRVLSSLSLTRAVSTAEAGAKDSLDASRVAQLRMTAASDFAASAIHALRRTGVERNQLIGLCDQSADQLIGLCDLISEAAQLPCPEVRDELLAVGVLDALTESLVVLAARPGPGDGFLRVKVPAASRAVAETKTPGDAVPTSGCLATELYREGAESTAVADAAAAVERVPPDQSSPTPSAPIAVPDMHKMSGDAQEPRVDHAVTVPKLGFRNMRSVAGCDEAPRLGFTRSARRALARSNRAEPCFGSSAPTSTSGATADARAPERRHVNQSSINTGGSGGACPASRSLWAEARKVGETLLMADFSAVLAHNRRCRRNGGVPIGGGNAESVDGTRGADVSTSSRMKMEETAEQNAAVATSAGNVAHGVLDAVKALAATGCCASGLETVNDRSESTSTNSTLSIGRCPMRLMSALSAVLCASLLEKPPSQSDTSMREGCISALVAYRHPLKQSFPDAVDPLLLRLRGHVLLIHESGTSSKGGVTAEDEVRTERLLRLTGDYVGAAAKLGHGELAVVSETLAYARSVCVVGAAGDMRPAAWRPQRLRAADAWVGAASAVASKVTGGGGDALSAELLVSLFLGRRSTLAWVRGYADHVLFSERAFTDVGGRRASAGSGAGVLSDARETVAVRRRVLSYFTSLMKLVAAACPPALEARDRARRDRGAARDGDRRSGGRAVGPVGGNVRASALLSRLDFVVTPETGFVSRILAGGERREASAGDDRVSTSSSRSSPTENVGVPYQPSEVCVAALLLAETAFSVPATPFLSSRALIDAHAHNHFLSALRRYNSPSIDGVHVSEAWTAVVTGHLRVLLAMSRAQDVGSSRCGSASCVFYRRVRDDARQRWQTNVNGLGTAGFSDGVVGECGDAGRDAVARIFHRLRVLDFMSREINLEYEISQRISRVQGRTDATPDETRSTQSAQTRAEVENVDAQTRPTHGDVTSTTRPEIPQTSSLAGGKPSIPALKLAPNPSRTDAAVHDGHNASVSEHGVVGKYRGPTIPKLGLNLSKRTDGVAQNMFANLSRDDSSDDDGRPADGFVGDLMEDVERAEALEEIEMMSGSKHVSDGNPTSAVSGEKLTDGAVSSNDARATSRDVLEHFDGEHADTSYATTGDGDGREPFASDPADEFAGASVSERDGTPVAHAGGQVVCEAYEGQSDGRGVESTARGGQRDDQGDVTSTGKHRSSSVDASSRVVATWRPPSLLAVSAAPPSQAAKKNNNMQNVGDGAPSAPSLKPLSRQTWEDGGADDKENARGTDESQTMDSIDSTREDVYASERANRRLYNDDHVHVTVLELLLALLVGADGDTRKGGVESVSGASGDVDNAQSSPAYAAQHASQLQLHDLKQNVTFYLRAHLNHAGNASIVPAIASAAAALGKGAERLLRLSCDALFRPGRYAARALVARGAYAQVHRCSLPSELGTLHSTEVALKIIDTPQSAHDPASAVDVYAEIAVFEAMARDPRVATLLDYGVSGESFFVVMKHYPASLKQWRSAHGHDGAADEIHRRMPLYLGVYAQCVEAVGALEKHGVVHYDVKADNFLLEPSPGCSAEDFWNPREDAHDAPFRVVVTDFGESRLFQAGDTAGTARNRGTEYVKSPEMLTVSNAAKKDGKSYDRRRRHTCGRASDVWALGCLLYEILTDTYM